MQAIVPVLQDLSTGHQHVWQISASKVPGLCVRGFDVVNLFASPNQWPMMFNVRHPDDCMALASVLAWSAVTCAAR